LTVEQLIAAAAADGCLLQISTRPRLHQEKGTDVAPSTDRYQCLHSMPEQGKMV
jgi:hypothetical protein